MSDIQEIKGYFIADADFKDIPEMIAKLFCNLDSRGQAMFFNAVCNISNKWAMPPEFQWRYMQDDLNQSARNMLLDMYEHTDGVE